jgi:hypothetical protein
MCRKSFIIALIFIISVFFVSQMNCAHQAKKEKGEIRPTLYKGWAEKTIKVTGKGAIPSEA